MLKLNNIKDSASVKKAKRVGRGIGSGTGKTSGAGHKGQKARSGVAIKGFEGGQMPLHRRLPKRGFKNPFRVEYSVINLGDIERAITEKKLNIEKEITKEDLHKAGLIRKKNSEVKILANGKISQSINIQADKVSKSALKAVTEKKGTVSLVEAKKKIPIVKNKKEAKEKKQKKRSK
ncbi:50S ribosomal protein L15 [Alphaproteobacteria bacterium]|nr:50S ribosomal protein L15 [Alphaproteobacteria bacterium]